MTERNVQQSSKSHISNNKVKSCTVKKIFWNSEFIIADIAKPFWYFLHCPQGYFFPQLIIRNYLCILSVNLGLEFSAQYKKLGQQNIKIRESKITLFKGGNISEIWSQLQKQMLEITIIFSTYFLCEKMRKDWTILKSRSLNLF